MRWNGIEWLELLWNRMDARQQQTTFKQPRHCEQLFRSSGHQLSGHLLCLEAVHDETGHCCWVGWLPGCLLINMDEEEEEEG